MRYAALFISLVLGLAVLLAACADPVTAPEVSVHPVGFAQAAVHGQVVLESPNDAQSCTSCHGTHLQGGDADVSCYSCHADFPHPEGFGKAGHATFHAGQFGEEISWDVTRCMGCHGEDFAGKGVAEKNCRLCHEQEPTGCTTCHGNTLNAAPPEDLAGHTEPTFRGVGLHQAHLAEGDVSNLGQDACRHCHAPVEAFTAPTHLDGLADQDPAEVVFSAFATQGGRATPVWDAAAGTCSDVYCHGSFTFLQEESRNPWGYGAEAITGNDLSVAWTAPGADQLRCGSCHGLPPEGHRVTDDRVTVGACSDCHPRVVDESYNIIDKGLHINGQVDLF